ncbi:hypothetical protein [Vibrio diabolicus]|uniref:hypothetical protein n=1 Tax=Vibrio diabolicus TaxID=50719 RepID=UPI00293FB33B|nr:hypothetical protein [Vibrio diabolicus]MDV5035151.1 hypothetical protein [Vibrio diabolicus]
MNKKIIIPLFFSMLSTTVTAQTCENYLNALDVINDNLSSQTQVKKAQRTRSKALMEADEAFEDNASQEQLMVMKIVNGTKFKLKRYLNLINYCEREPGEDIEDVSYKADINLVSQIMNHRGYYTCRDVGSKPIDNLMDVNTLGYQILGKAPVYTRNGQIFASKYDYEPLSLSSNDIKDMMSSACSSVDPLTPLFVTLELGFKDYRKELIHKKELLQQAIRKEYSEQKYDLINDKSDKLVRDITNIIGKEKSYGFTAEVRKLRKAFSKDIESIAKSKFEGEKDINPDLLTENGYLKSQIAFARFIIEKQKITNELKALRDETLRSWRDPDFDETSEDRYEEFLKQHFYY